MAQRGMTRAAVEQLFVEHEKRLYNVVYRWVYDADDAAELVQDAFVRLWRTRDDVDPERAHRLVYRIALNLAASKRRWRRVRRWVRPDPPASTESGRPDAQALRFEQAAHVRRALEDLPEHLRRVVVMCELSDLKYDDIAAVLGVAPGTVGSRRNTAMKRLRRAFEDQEAADARA